MSTYITRTDLPQELSAFHIVVEDLSHHCAELQHHITPAYAGIINPSHHAEHPGIKQALHGPCKNVAELWGRLLHEPSQHVLLLIAQSRELALHALAGEVMRTRLAECGLEFGQKRHPHQSSPDCCIFVCYPRGTEQMSEHGAQPEKLSTPTAHIFTEEETRELFKKAYHAHHSTTEPAAPQEESAQCTGGTVTLTLQQLANVLYLSFMLKQLDEQKDTTFHSTVDKIALLIAVLLGGIAGRYL